MKVQRKALKSWGESAAGLITNLLIAYNTVIDPVFKAYMTNHLDTSVVSKVIFTKEEIMEVVVNKFQILMELEMWNAPSAHDSQIIALTTEVYILKRKKSKNTPYEKKGQQTI